MFPALSFYLTLQTCLPRRTLWDEQLLKARALLCFCILLSNQCRPVRQQVFNKHLWMNRSCVLISATAATLPSPGAGSPSSVSLLLKQVMVIPGVPCISFAADGLGLDFSRPLNHSKTFFLSCGWSRLVFRLLLSLALASSCDPVHPSWDSAFCQLSLE